VFDERYLNRELSWLDFNERVLVVAEETTTPLLERCKFSAIFSSNLDEFFQIRVAALKDRVAAEVATPAPDGRTPAEQLGAIGVRVRDLVVRQERLWSSDLAPSLRAAGIDVKPWDALNWEERAVVSAEFEERIFPVLTPLAVDPAHPFPYISNLALNLAVMVHDPHTGDRRFARVKMPANIARFVPTGVADAFVLLEDVVRAHLPRLFPGMEIEHSHAFRVTRNADLALDDEDAEDVLAAVEIELRRRRFGRAVRLEVADDIADDVLRLLLDELELGDADVVRLASFLDATSLHQLAVLDRPFLRFRPWPPVTAGRLAIAAESGRSVFDVIRDRQLLVHHPYESFTSSTELFVAQAAADPQVQSIKATLYRTSGDSSIARQLIAAAESGKQVAAVLELKARFDEARNVSWAKELELAGVHVTYGLVGLKTHAKCVLVVRNESDGIRRYVHLGTGNYNAVTARIYEDFGYFTCEPDVGADATELFNSLTGFARRPDLRTLIAAPHQLRRRVIQLIDGEATRGDAGSITMKLNSLSDPEVIEALYRASAAGTSVNLVVRGICCLRAGVPGLSERITVRSILGRFLEHSRVYRFLHGLNGEPLHLIGSADMMGRNLDGRVEVLVPVTHPKHRAWLDRTLDYLLDVDSSRFDLQSDGTWARHRTDSDAQQRMYDWVRGSQAR